MITIRVFGAKGGVGTTTIACVIAATLAEHHKVRLTSVHPADISSVLSTAATRLEMPDGGFLRIVGPPVEEYDFTVSDAGVAGPDERYTPYDVLVTMNTYLSLRHVTATSVPEHVVLQYDPRLPISVDDAVMAINSEVHLTTHNEIVGRALDAGQFLTMRDRPWRNVQLLARGLAIGSKL